MRKRHIGAVTFAVVIDLFSSRADSESSTPLRGRSIEPLPPPPPDLEFSTPTRSISGLRFASGTNSLNSSQYSLPPFPDNYGQVRMNAVRISLERRNLTATLFFLLLFQGLA